MAMAQTKGNFEIHDFGSFRLHVYYSHDVMNDASYIVEGREALVTMEQPLFRENVAEFDAYLSGLDKPVAKRITDYHVGGTGCHEVVMPEGMPAFTEGPVYGGMMRHFATVFGDAMTDLPTGRASEVAFGETRTWAGVDFEFRPGAATDFPGASILIGGKIYYTHWTPLRAHASHLQLSSAAAVEAEIAEAERSIASGAVLFIGGHGGAVGADAVKFRIAYLRTLGRLLAENADAGAFAAALRAAYPGLPGEEGVGELARALYAAQ